MFCPNYCYVLGMQFLFRCNSERCYWLTLRVFDAKMVTPLIVMGILEAVTGQMFLDFPFCFHFWWEQLSWCTPG